MKKSWRTILKRNKNREALLKRSIGCLVAAGVIAGAMATGYAAPQGGQVTTGSAAIQHDGANTTIHQHSDRAAIQWDSFNIGRGEQVKFIQPNESSIALNRVLSNQASHIYGTLTANGKVFLINPSGVMFAPGSSVNVGGLVVATSNITDEQLLRMSDNPAEQDRGEFYGFRGGQGGMIINQGNISAVSGNVELFGSIVNNQGVIAATNHILTTTGSVRLVGNTVDLAAGSKIEAANQVVLRSDADGSGLGSMNIAANTVTAPETAVYYRPAAYDDAATKSDAAGNPYSALLPATNVTGYMLVNTVQDLQNINANLGGYYALNNNLDFAGVNFAPLGNGSAFSGKLDGSSYQIANLSIHSDDVNVGLFGSLDHAAISDLIISNASVLGRGFGTNTTAGILAGRVAGSTLKNIAVNGKIESAAAHVGGVVGYSTNSTLAHISSATNVTGSQWYANVGGVAGVLDNSSIIGSMVGNADLYKVRVSGQAHSNVGGIAGQLINDGLIDGVRIDAQSVITGQSASNLGGLVGASTNGSILASVNAGTVGVASGEGQHLLGSKVGGIVGMNHGGILDASNEGIVDGGYAQYIGGIAGYHLNADYNGNNVGTVTGRADGSYVGGIFGFAARSDMSYVSNTGSVTNLGNNSFTGGIVGAAQHASIYQTDNYGTVTAVGTGTSIGGIAGSLENVSVGNYVYNRGDVVGGSRNSNIGGIAGFIKSGGLYRGWNLAAVTDSVNLLGGASNNNIGGVYGKAVNASVTDAWNFSDVSSNNTYSNIGGVIGMAQNVYLVGGRNFATVAGQHNSDIGGIVGRNIGNDMSNCDNHGDITGYGWHVGGIAGNNLGGTIRNSENTGGIISQAYGSYIGGIAGHNQNGSIIKAINSGAIEGYGNGSAVGGIVGSNWQQSVIAQAYNSGEVSANGETTNTGGIAGSNGADSSIANSYNTAAVHGGSKLYSAAGGLVGWHKDGSIINSYSKGAVSSGQSGLVGALVGKAGISPQVVPFAAVGLVNCYFDADMNSGLRAVGNVLATTGANGLTAAGMADRNSFDSWDFDSIWTMDVEAGRPVLRL